MLVYGQDELISAWIGERLGVTFTPPHCCIGVARDGELVAGILYNGYLPPDIEMTIASSNPRWASRQVIGRLLAFPFLELSCGRVTAKTKAGNRPARQFLRRLGFKQEGFHPGRYPDDDGVSYGLMRADATPWLKGFTDERFTNTRIAATDPAGSAGPRRAGGLQ